MRRLVVWLGILLAVGLLCGCTTVPSSSSPEVVGSAGGAAPLESPAITPSLNADPRTIVSEFLGANATDVGNLTGARAFLTPDAQQRWNGKTGVTVVDFTQIGNYSNGSVVVTGHRLGALNASGIYTPTLQGNGGGGPQVQFTFGMKKVGGQWRIDALQNGVIVDSAQFDSTYQQRSVYFYDIAEQHLVPDPRYSAIDDPALLANWLVSQLADGPRPELQDAVSSELPGSVDPGRVTVTFESPVQVQVPGAGQLDPQTRNRLAAQLAVTLRPVVSGSLSIVDNGRAISIPQAGGTSFSADDFPSAMAAANPSPTLFYVRDGRVVDSGGAPVTGDAGTGAFGFTSVALARTSGQALRIAGTTGPATSARLLVGTLTGGIHPTPVRGRLTRPTWAPGLDEVWVGAGSTVYRVSLSGAVSAVPVSAAAGTVSGRVTALRFSPEGSRIAIVLTSASGDTPTSQVWIGSVTRSKSGGQVRVDNLEPITPQGVAITDVAWNGQLKLFAIGRDTTTGSSSVYELQVDGSLWTPRGTSNLPQAPDSITVAENEVAWVSAGGTVWAQRAGTWVSPGPGPVAGTNPVYLE